MWLWRLRSPTISCLQAVHPGKLVVLFSLSPKTWESKEPMVFLPSDAGGLRTRLGCGWRDVDLSPRVQRPRTQGPEVQGQETRDIPAQEVRARTHLSFTFLVGSVQAAKGLDDVRLSR